MKKAVIFPAAMKPDKEGEGRVGLRKGIWYGNGNGLEIKFMRFRL